MQRQLSDLHAQIDELKDTLCDVKKSYRNTEAVLTKEHIWVKDLEQELKDLKSRLPELKDLKSRLQELKDLKSHLQVKANASTLPPTTLVTAEPKSWVVIPAWSPPQPEAGPS